MERNRVVVIGLGGIGSWLVQGICPFLNYQNPNAWSLVLVDGDEYEDKNHSRQVFTELGPKATVQASWIARSFPNLTVHPICDYVSAKTTKDSRAINEVIETGDIVFSCVDNHKTRRVISKHCATLADITLISGGNEFSDGNTQTFVRRKGENLTATLEKYHPEIAKPKDKAPHEMSCEEAMQSSPQLIFCNLNASVIMLNTFYTLGMLEASQLLTEERLSELSEIYFDIIVNKAIPRARKK